MGKVFVQVGNSVGETRIPGLGIALEQLFLLLYPLLLIPAIAFWLRHVRRERRDKLNPRGHTRLGRTGSSHLGDEQDSKYTIRQSTASSSSGWTVKALFIHPIKSCGAVELDHLDVDAAGPLWDRKFAFAELITPQTRLDAPEEAKKPRWTFRTLRQPGFEKMALVKPEIWLRDNDGGKQDEGVLIVKYPYLPRGLLAPLDRLMMRLGFMAEHSSFSVPLVPPENHQYPLEDVNIWKDTPKWLNYGRHVPQDFQIYIGAKGPLTLFRADPQSYRQLFRNAPRKEQLGYQPVVGFQDAYPLHLMNLASVRDLAEKVHDSIPNFTARRFRWNILVSGGSQYDEDDWQRIQIGNQELYCACHTIRCRLPNVDPDTSERHPIEPDKTLKSFRCIDDGDPMNAALGLQLVPARSEVIRIKVGDDVKVLERGEHHYIKQ